MARELLERFADKPVKCRRPIDEDANPRKTIDTTSHPSTTCSYKVFDPSVDESLSAAEISTATVINVTNVGKFKVNQSVEITLDSGVLHLTTIGSIQLEDGTVTIDDQLTDAAAAGNRIRVSYGAATNMPQYGTADFNTEEWGFKENLADTHAVHRDPRSQDGFDINIEITLLVGAAQTKRTKKICLTIKENCENA